MRQDSFEIEIFIKSDVKSVIQVLTDYSQLHQIHPLVEKVESIEPPVGLKSYRITDNLQWGIFKFKIQYRTDVISITENSVHANAYQFPKLTITNITTVMPAPNGVMLREKFTMQAPSLLFTYSFQQAHTSHTEMLKRVKRFIESKK